MNGMKRGDLVKSLKRIVSRHTWTYVQTPTLHVTRFTLNFLDLSFISHYPTEVTGGSKVWEGLRLFQPSTAAIKAEALMRTSSLLCWGLETRRGGGENRGLSNMVGTSWQFA